MDIDLRDYFAAKAMQALISNLSYGAEIQRIFDPEKTIALKGAEKETPQTYLLRVAYVFADAALAERLKPTE